MKVFLNGLQRTGTNYVLKLFRQNLPNVEFKDDTHHPYYHKHNLYNFKNPFTDKYPDKILTIIKHPYSWVESICFRNCVDIKRWFPNYYLHNTQDYCGPFQINLKNLCKLYYDFYDTWLKTQQITLIQYERTLTQKDIQREIFKLFNIKPKQITLPKTIPQSDDFVYERKEIYRNYRTQHLNDSQKQIIKECLSKDFLNRIKYRLS